MLSSNLRRIMVRQGMTIRDVTTATGINERTIKSLLTDGRKPHAKTLHRLADGLGVTTDELISNSRVEFDRITNPTVKSVIDEHPHLVQDWNEFEIEELFSRFGTGGELTRGGVIEAVKAMNAKRKMLEKAAVLMESEHATLLNEFIEMLYTRATSDSPDPS